MFHKRNIIHWVNSKYIQEITDESTADMKESFYHNMGALWVEGAIGTEVRVAGEPDVGCAGQSAKW